LAISNQIEFKTKKGYINNKVNPERMTDHFPRQSFEKKKKKGKMKYFDEEKNLTKSMGANRCVW
jgi:hypothetical protein